jgi:hypothetical protein
VEVVGFTRYIVQAYDELRIVETLCIAIIIVMVHSHLMLSQCLNENLGGILGGTQC